MIDNGEMTYCGGMTNMCTMGNDRQFRMTYNGEYHIMNEERQWYMATIGSDKQWGMTDHGEWQIMLIDR